ncbi:MAG: tetratricopeptide repeat protein [candidate division NC10 bacterium]|nr:tetratricopeptide repeat protein [candidate division NC10 bacterium]
MAEASPRTDRAHPKTAEVARDARAGRLSAETRRRLDELVKRLQLSAGRGGIFLVSLPTLDQALFFWGAVRKRTPPAWHYRIADVHASPDVLAEIHADKAVAPGRVSVLGVIPPDPGDRTGRQSLLTSLNVRREAVFESHLLVVLFLDPEVERDLVAWAKDFFVMRTVLVRLTQEPPIHRLDESEGVALLRKQNARLKREIRVALASGSKEVAARLMAELGGNLLRLGHMPEAIRHYTQALALHREIGDRQGEANQLANLGIVHRIKGDLDGATRHHTQALAIDREIGDRQGEANQLGNLGIVYRARGDMETARRFEAEAQAIRGAMGIGVGDRPSKSEESAVPDGKP